MSKQAHTTHTRGTQDPTHHTKPSRALGTHTAALATKTRYMDSGKALKTTGRLPRPVRANPLVSVRRARLVHPRHVFLFCFFSTYVP